MPVFVKQLGAKPFSRCTELDDIAYGMVYDLHYDHDPADIAAASARADIPLLLKSKKGGDWAEWPIDLRVREYPREKVTA